MPTQEQRAKRRADLTALGKAVSVDPEYFTTWERSFIESIMDEFNEMERLYFSPKSEQVLNQLIEKVNKR